MAWVHLQGSDKDRYVCVGSSLPCLAAAAGFVGGRLLRWSITNFPSAEGRRSKFTWSSCMQGFSPALVLLYLLLETGIDKNICKVDVIARD